MRKKKARKKERKKNVQTVQDGSCVCVCVP